MHITVDSYQPADRSAIRRILLAAGWDARYIAGMEAYTDQHAGAGQTHGMSVARLESEVAGFIFVQFHAWNRLAQIQGLAVDPQFQRRGIARALVAHAESFAQLNAARGIYVDTPVDNERGRQFYEALDYAAAYVMPRYYADTLDGITYQKFFTEKST